MFTVALTGGIGCGKSEASHIFAEFDVPIVDLDVISHQLTDGDSHVISAITEHFGREFINSDGALDRAAMRHHIFSNENARKHLNSILHPAIYNEAVKQLQAETHAPYILLTIPLLDEGSAYIPLINRILVIDCDEATQIARVKQRSKLSQAEIMQIIQTQTPRLERLDMADDVIENTGNIAKLRKNIEELHQAYIKACIDGKTIP